MKGDDTVLTTVRVVARKENNLCLKYKEKLVSPTRKRRDAYTGIESYQLGVSLKDLQVALGITSDPQLWESWTPRRGASLLSIYWCISMS